MKRFPVLLLTLGLFFPLCSCQTTEQRSADRTAVEVRQQTALLDECTLAMKAFGEERIYVAIEPYAAEEGQEEIPTLVSFVKESDPRTPVENEALETAIRRFSLARIFFQTSSDNRQSVLFSFGEENDEGIVSGFYYSFDGKAHGWWGRRAELVRRGGRYWQIGGAVDISYYTVAIGDGYYYFEKHPAA